MWLVLLCSVCHESVGADLQYLTFQFLQPSTTCFEPLYLNPKFLLFFMTLWIWYLLIQSDWALRQWLRSRCKKLTIHKLRSSVVTVRFGWCLSLFVMPEWLLFTSHRRANEVPHNLALHEQRYWVQDTVWDHLQSGINTYHVVEIVGGLCVYTSIIFMHFEVLHCNHLGFSHFELTKWFVYMPFICMNFVETRKWWDGVTIQDLHITDQLHIVISHSREETRNFCKSAHTLDL